MNKSSRVCLLISGLLLLTITEALFCYHQNQSIVIIRQRGGRSYMSCDFHEDKQVAKVAPGWAPCYGFELPVI